MKNHLKDLREVDPTELIPNPKNPNRHSIEQIAQFDAILNYQGWRHCIIVSNQSGFIVSGHLRHQVALNLELKTIPVSFQDFEDDEQEKAHMIADNELARQAELDKHLVIEIAKETKFKDIKVLGLEKDFITPCLIDIEAKEPKISNNQESEESEEKKETLEIEFDSEHLEETEELIKWWKAKGAYIGYMFLNYLRQEKQKHEEKEVK